MAPDTTLPPAITSNTRPAGVGTGGAASADGVGADGVGDPYYPKAGNSGYDVQRYDLVMDVRIKGADHLDATATIGLTPTQDLRRFDLDLLGFEVSEVTVDGSSASFVRDGRELVITPASALRAGTPSTVVVHYAGTPGHTGSESGGLDGGADGGWVDLGDDWSTVIAEPIGAATWFPSNDHPSDKAIVSVSATVPTGLTAVAGGVFDGNGDAGAGVERRGLGRTAHEIKGLPREPLDERTARLRDLVADLDAADAKRRDALDEGALLRASQGVRQLVRGEEDDPADREGDDEDRADERDGRGEVGVHAPPETLVHGRTHHVQDRRAEKPRGKRGDRDEDRDPQQDDQDPGALLLGMKEFHEGIDGRMHPAPQRWYRGASLATWRASR